MKKQILLSLFLLTAIMLNAQDSFKNNVFATASPMYPIYGWNSGIDGGGSTDGKMSYAVGLEYSRNIIPKLELLTGISYVNNNIDWKGSYMGQEEVAKGTYHINFISVPLQARYTFGSWFFVNGGGILNFKTSSDHERDSAFGLLFGLGGRIPLNERCSLIVNPYFQMNFLSDSEHMHFYNVGAKLGLGYKF